MVFEIRKPSGYVMTCECGISFWSQNQSRRCFLCKRKLKIERVREREKVEKKVMFIPQFQDMNGDG
jgi:hypothetical protein